MIIFLINFIGLMALSFFVVYSNRSIPENKSYASCAAVVGLVNLMRFASSLADSERAGFFLSQVGWAALVFLPAVFFHFAVQVHHNDENKKIKYLPVLYLVSLFLFVLNLTPYFISSVKKINDYMVLIPGLLFHVFTAFSLLVGLGVVIMTTGAIKKESLGQQDRLRSLRLGTIFAGAILAMNILSWTGVSALYFSRYFVIPVFIWLAYVSVYFRNRIMMRIMRGSLVAVIMALIFSLIFLVISLVSESILTRPFDYRIMYPMFLTGFILVFVYGHLKKWIDQEVTKMFFRKRFESEKVSRGLSRQILSILKREEIYNYILSTAGFLLNCQKLAIFALDSPDGRFTLQAVSGFDHERLQHITFPKKSFFVKHLLNTKRNISWESIISDYRKIKIREELELINNEGLRYFVPFISQENVLAILAAGDKEGGAFYSDEDRDLLAGLVANGTMAIENIQLMELNEKLKELDEMKRDFISNVTHELKSPLTAIQSCVEFLLKKKGGDLTRVQMDYLVMVQNNSVRLTRFISQLLDISRIEAARLDLYKEEVSIPNIAQEIALLFGPYAEEKGVKIRVSSQPDVMEILADQDKLKQVFTNLISNALKFTDHGEITIRISDKPAYVEAQISDSGVGIPKDALDKLFDKFFQVKETHKAKKYGGTGLGLAIVKGIIDAHNGRISVTSELGKGTTFTVTLPKEDWGTT